MDKGKIEVQSARTRAALTKALHELDALDAVLREEQTPGQQAKALVGVFCAAWNGRYTGTVYMPNWPKDIPLAKRLLASFAFDDLAHRAVVYLMSQDPFYVNARHPIGLFASSINKWGAAVDQGGDESFLSAPVTDCKHRPACRSDQEHTRRKVADARA